ncbi:MAG: M56 family metallopeptidase [Marinicaulis sp.]|nr:M56 family metallopeptidase [Marinicaulis sp.]
MIGADVFDWFIETTIAVSVLTAVILGIRKPFARVFGARAAYCLWLAPLVRIFLPELKILPRAPNPITIADTGFVVQYSAAAPVAVEPLSALEIGVAALIFIWIAGAVAWLGLRFEKQAAFRRAMMAASSPAGDGIPESARAIAREFGVRRLPEIRIVHELYGPALIGLVRPIIVLPANFKSAYNDEEQRLALAHEISHLARGDMAAMFVSTLIQAVQWPNPLAHFAAHAFRLDQEAACDAFVLSRETVRARANYASAILKSAKTGARATGLELSLSHPVKERIMLIKNSKTGAGRMLGGSVMAIAIVIGGLTATATYGYAEEEKRVEKRIVKKHVDGVVKKRIVITSDDENLEDLDFVFSDDSEAVITGDENFVFESSDGERRVVRLHKEGKGGRIVHKGHCTAGEGEPEPLKLEWKDESDDGEYVEKGVICISGEDAGDPKSQIAAAKKAIDEMETNAKRQEQRRKRMIAGLRAELKKLERENR